MDLPCFVCVVPTLRFNPQGVLECCILFSPLSFAVHRAGWSLRKWGISFLSAEDMTEEGEARGLAAALNL